MSKLLLRIFDGGRQLFAAPSQFLITITDGNQTQRFRDSVKRNAIAFDELPYFNNFGDNYSVVVSADGLQQAGFTPLKLSDGFVRTVDIMLIPNDLGFSFVNARWNAALNAYPFLAGDIDTTTAQGMAAAEARYENFLDQQEKPLACLLNICEAMSQIHLPQGTPLDYIKQLHWSEGDGDPFAPKQDRFFAWCDARLIDQVKVATQAGLFAPEADPALFHAGATSSWKQVQFGEANVQLTFHEEKTQKIGGVDCVLLEPDIDYFKDLGAHALLEVVPNAITHSLTDPAQVYALRWIAGRTTPGVPEFAPLYTIT
jgi:hypothetical protein